MKRSIIITGILIAVGIVVISIIRNHNVEQKPPEPTGTEVEHNPEWFCKTIEVPDDQKRQAVGGKTKFWPTGSILKIGFIGGTSAKIATVKAKAPEWCKYANLTFQYPASGPYDVRVAFNTNDGAWSYVGTDAKQIAQNQPTINLGWISDDVIWHEFGHALGLHHEHQNPEGGICWNEQAVIQSLSGPPNYWTVSMIRSNVLDKLPLSEVITSPWDRNSIMHYSIPASWVCNAVAIPGGITISAGDKDFIAKRYPGVKPPVTTSITLTATQVDSLLKDYGDRLADYQKTLAEFDRITILLKQSNERTKKLLGR